MKSSKIKSNLSAYYQSFRHSNVRQAIWPIRSFELFKFTPMALLMFTILLNQNVVRNLKDSLVITLVGPEVINFIKLWGEMPLGVLFVIVYSHMCNKMSTEKAFRIIIAFFLIFYTLFAFVLYPYYQYFHPNPDTITFLVEQHPHFKWFIIMWGKWSFVLIYIMGELWPIILFSLLFWQLANKITKTEEASRFYPFFSIFGQANCLVASSIVIYFSSQSHFLLPLFSQIEDRTEVTIKSLILVVIASGVLSMIIQRYIEKTVIDKMEPEIAKLDQDEKENIKLGVIDSLKLILKSKYLCYMAIILISYSFAMNLIEGLWMSKAREMYQTTEGLLAYNAKVLFWTGVVTMTCALIGSTLIRKLGWIWAAILTPIMLLTTGTIFYISVLSQNSFEVIDLFGHPLTPIMFIVLIGALQHIFSKGLKYSLFDATKEMAYIPLDNESKTKGKAAADILGAKIGKSAGAIIQITIITIYPSTTYNDMAGLLMVLFIAICTVWIFTIIKLSKLYNKKVTSLEG